VYFFGYFHCFLGFLWLFVTFWKGIILTDIQDLPFQTWVAHRDEYLDEMLRLEGRGSADVYSTCGSCGAPNPIYRCEVQNCYGLGMFCKTCVVAQHEVLPTHWIQVRRLVCLCL
jgi:hypothetical protein